MENKKSTGENLPRVAVVIPAYNSAGFIDRAIHSALAQDYPNKEIIVVDDGSTDETAEVVQSYGPPVRYFYQSNAGPDVARNRGIEAAADAEFIAFLDSDDEYLPGRLSQGLRPMLEDPEVVLTFCKAREQFPDGTSEIRGQVTERYRAFPPVFWPSGYNATPNTTCRRSVLLECGGFDRPLLAFADMDLWIRVREHGRAVMIDQPLVVIHARSSSRSRNKDEEAVRACYFQIVADGLARRPDLYEPHRATIYAESHLMWGIRYSTAGQRQAARRELKASLANRFSKMALGLLVLNYLPPVLLQLARRLARYGLRKTSGRLLRE